MVDRAGAPHGALPEPQSGAIWLAASGGNERIEAVLAGGSIRVDRVKLGSWMGDAQLAALAAAHPALLHVSDGIAWPRTGRWVEAQARRTQLAAAPWVSFHLDIGWTYLAYHWSGPSPVPRDLALRWATANLRRLSAAVPVPVLAENMPRWDNTGPPYVVDPAFISSVVRAAGCHLLLDLAHARVSAAHRGQPVQDYLNGLPLGRVLEVHVSGPRPHPAHGRLFDAHEPLLEEDYVLLEWVLHRCRPCAVTLEYSKDERALREQLERLRRVLDASTAAGTG